MNQKHFTSCVGFQFDNHLAVNFICCQATWAAHQGGYTGPAAHFWCEEWGRSGVKWVRILRLLLFSLSDIWITDFHIYCGFSVFFCFSIPVLHFIINGPIRFSLVPKIHQSLFGLSSCRGGCLHVLFFSPYRHFTTEKKGQRSCVFHEYFTHKYMSHEYIQSLTRQASLIYLLNP